MFLLFIDKKTELNSSVKQNLIITAVDNLQARKFVDKKCTFYSLALIDAGTNGTNASSDIFYPGKTICLNDLPEPTETKIPLCTLKKFPTQIKRPKIEIIEINIIFVLEKSI